MRSLAAAFLFVVSTASSGWASDYTGVWKGECTDGFGLWIERASDSLYSVSFCGPGRCADPGEWAPNTPIDGDPKYSVGPDGELKVARRDGSGFSTYVRCDSEPTWKRRPRTASPASSPSEDCPVGAPPEPGVLIAWITNVRTTRQFGGGMKATMTIVQPFRPLALLDGTSLREVSRSGIQAGQPFWRIVDPESKPLRLSSVDSFLDHMGEDHCVYFGTVEGATPADGTLLSSRPLPGLFGAPTPASRATFERLNPSCTQQNHDHPSGEAPAPCARPELLAVSDIDKNGMLEYWSREPYAHDFGLTVWEDRGALVPLLEVCVGCRD